MEARSSSDGISNYSSGELHEHGEGRRMVESQEEAPRPIIEIKK
jgi:hypothetical protein